MNSIAKDVLNGRVISTITDNQSDHKYVL